jgi:hypothetical protein
LLFLPVLAFGVFRVALPFSKFEDFAGLVRHNGADMKPMLLRVLTDFYIQKPVHTDLEDKHFTELALRLIDEVDADIRAVTADRLKAHGAAPAIVMERLLRTDALKKPESNTVEVKAAAPLSAPAMKPRESHATPADADRAAAAHFSDMFFAADSDGRKAILQQLESGTALPSTLTRADAAAAVARLDAAALKGRPFEFVREIEQTLGVPRVYSEKIVTDSSGEAMLVVAKALDMPSDVLQRILLLVNPAIGMSVRRVFDLSALYEDLAPQSALRLIMLWRHGAMARGPAHQPVQAPAADHRQTPQRQSAPASKRDQRAS